jgi:hypothetical protein
LQAALQFVPPLTAIAARLVSQTEEREIRLASCKESTENICLYL